MAGSLERLASVLLAFVLHYLEGIGGMLWLERREAGWEWTGNARVGGECSDRADIGGRRENVESQYHSRPVADVLPPGAFSQKVGTVRGVWARAVPALTLTFWLADVDCVELEPASNRKRLTADDGHVVEAIDAIEPAAGVQHRLAPRSETTLGAP